jgi:hypothetical protein
MDGGLLFQRGLTGVDDDGTAGSGATFVLHSHFIHQKIANSRPVNFAHTQTTRTSAFFITRPCEPRGLYDYRKYILNC